MNKDYIVGVIEKFENSSQPLSEELRSKLKQIRSNINSMNQDDFDLLSNGAVRVSPTIESNVEQNPLEELREVYSNLERIALSGNSEHELERAINQLRGALGIQDRYYP